MNDKRPALRYGRVVYAWIKDYRGFAKLRPGLILTPDDLIDENKSWIVAAITTTFPPSPPKNHIQIPWHPQGKVSTQLRNRSAVVLDWQSIVSTNEIAGFGGDVPAKTMLAIERRLDELV